MKLNQVHKPSASFLFLPIAVVFSYKKMVSDHQSIHISAHEAAIGILRGAYYRFATDIEARIGQKPVTGFSLKRLISCQYFSLLRMETVYIRAEKSI